jgi:hypothetical protein
MRGHAIVALSVVSACGAAGHDPTRTKPFEEPHVTGEATLAEPVLAARQPVSGAYCAAACAAAAAQDCQKLAAMCRYDTSGDDYVNVGGRALHCQPACAAACAGQATGQDLCTRACLAGHQ